MDSIFGIHESALRLASRRSELLAANLANADTPGYKARDLDFARLLGGDDTLALATTSAAHIGSGEYGLSGLEPGYRVPHQPSLDGNTVETDVEQSAFMENALRYQVTLRFIDSRISGLRTAIRGE